MYISRVRIEGFRCFRDTTIEFSPDLNVLIGENNSGKTTVLQALVLVFGRRESERLSAEDFHRAPTCPDQDPRIRVTVTLSSTKDEPAEHKAVVVSWLTRIETPWEATLTFAFSLPQKDAEAFNSEMKDLPSADTNAENRRIEYWRLVDWYLPRFVARIWGGNPASEIRAEGEWLDKISFQSLDAIRDVQARLFMGRNPMLREILETVLDRKVSDDAQREAGRKQFTETSQQLVKNVRGRIDLEDVLRVAKETGADVGGTPDLEGTLDESDLLAALRLMIRDNSTGVALPAILNGLGYNNLIYISLVMARLQIQSSDLVGENAKVFNVLCIEEPEAHLHPALQHRFLKFLLGELEAKGKDHQLFVTTHSTHITSAVGLESVIGLSCQKTKAIVVSYPGRVFDSSNDDDTKSRHYVDRYLDATKSTMLFCKGVVLIEGIAEQLLLPCLAEYEGFSVEESHVSVVRVDGVTFKHFLRLFGSLPGRKPAKHTMPTQVACVLDADPARRDPDAPKSRWVSCWPFELDVNAQYEYRRIQPVLAGLPSGPNVGVFQNDTGMGRTFEYDLAFANPACDLLITSACDNMDLLRNLMTECAKGVWFDRLDGEDERVYAALDSCKWKMKDKLKARFAANYLLAVEKSKGENALVLEQRLRENLKSDQRQAFIVPDHLRKAMEWICRK